MGSLPITSIEHLEGCSAEFQMLRGRRDPMLTLAFSLSASDPGFGRLDVL